ncbi:MAG: hypothetical protein O7C39_02405 [Bacteroidetes bacterium]|nr:hypothetical protein [Bacteroidota bacterium]
MQFILDNISATLIFSAVALAVVVTQFNSSQSTIESTVSYMSKKQTLELGATLELELKLIGQGTTQKIDEAVQNADGQTTSFIFWRNNGIVDLKVEFRLIPTDSIFVNGVEVQRYRMDRFENDVYRGGSAPTLRDFVIEPLDAFGNVVAPAAAVLVRARIRDTYPLVDPDDMHIGHSFWGMTVRPESL